MKLKTNSKTRKTLQIVGATMISLFTLFSVFSATMAWFISTSNVETAGNEMPVKSLGGCTIKDIRLIKYDYSTIALSETDIITDYFNLQNGAVNSYDFNEEEKTFGQFIEVDEGTGDYSYVDNEYVKGEENSGNYIWQAVEYMNVYDPFEKIIKGKNFALSDLYSNAVYEVTFSAPSSDYIINLTSRIKEDRTKEKGQIYLSTCADFDVFFEDDFLATVSSYSNEKTYAKNDLIIKDGIVCQCQSAINAPETYNSAHWSQVNAYSKTSTYSVGKAIIESDVIYVCKTAINTPEAFDASKWRKASSYSDSQTYEVGEIVFHNGAVYEANTSINTPETFDYSKWNPVLYNNTYCPSFKPTLTTDDENLYYKVSFLSSRRGVHSNFYNDEDADNYITLEDGDSHIVRQSPNEFKVYINVNYSPTQLNNYHTRISSPNDIIQAVYDFIFYFSFEEAHA